jgi:RNA polymerase sigma-70 factor (ECF subfamily)
MLGNREDARDVAQVSFLKAWEKLSTFDSRGHFFSWIYRIAINESLNHRGRRRAFESLDPGMPSDEPGPEETAERNEATRRVQAALLELRPDDRQVLVMRHFLQLSHCEIGEVLQVPDKTVKSRLHDARTRLEAVLRRRGFGAP